MVGLLRSSRSVSNLLDIEFVKKIKLGRNIMLVLLYFKTRNMFKEIDCRGTSSFFVVIEVLRGGNDVKFRTDLWLLGDADPAEGGDWGVFAFRSQASVF